MGRDIGQVIATRELGSERGPVSVEVGAPRRMPVEDRPAWMCGMRITGMRPEPLVLWAPGVDSMDALITALRMAGDQLSRSGLRLTCDGVENTLMPVTQADGSVLIPRATEQQLADAFGADVAAEMTAKTAALYRNMEDHFRNKGAADDE
ncbi:DUF6968 family protein [Nocardia sp. NPDC051570]|uniref:DUF6968 family protein n=1 Tax=Nocardia sp. NPDC051570 TaxID=3364324 RepID=UPI003792E3B3